jgi:uncharacterized membrane protein YdbT with pleckstrin-like domain
MKIGQYNIGKWWGRLLLAAGQISMLITLLTLGLAGIGAYPTVKGWAAIIGWDIALWQFGLIIVIIIGISLVFAWMFGMKSYFNQWNDQFWNHDNPMRIKLEELEKKIDNLTKKE